MTTKVTTIDGDEFELYHDEEFAPGELAAFCSLTGAEFRFALKLWGFTARPLN